MAFPVGQKRSFLVPGARLEREEAFSFYSHLAGAVVSVAGLVMLLQRAEGALSTLALATYGATLVAMFVSSALHHLTNEEEGLFRRIDMSAIYLFIAGTYTPICLLAMPQAVGLPLLGVVWLLALVGIALRWALPATPPWITVSLYLGLGWLGIVGIYPLWANHGWGAILPLAGGGIAYTVGAVVYASEKPDPFPRVIGHHGLWHVFVLVAAALHFWMVWSLASA